MYLLNSARLYNRGLNQLLAACRSEEYEPMETFMNE